MQRAYQNSIFWIEVEKIKPNPYQPRREFDEAALADLARSIRQYGVLQPLVVTRKEVERDDGIGVEYELIAGERRLRASKLAGLEQVPAVVRSSEESDMMKLELAIIENLQREDLNPMDRAHAFSKLAEEFKYKHGEIAERIGRSREYVSNTIRLLNLNEEMRQALRSGQINEGHTRPLLMLIDRPEDQKNLFLEIIQKRLNVREAEQISRKIAVEKVRKAPLEPALIDLEHELTNTLGTRVQIDKRSDNASGRIVIDFFSEEDLRNILAKLKTEGDNKTPETTKSEAQTEVASVSGELPGEPPADPDDSDLYSLSDFTV